ncbi:hypothetical protein MASR2M78_22640 [Treponema sp.]
MLRLPSCFVLFLILISLPPATLFALDFDFDFVEASAFLQAGSGGWNGNWNDEVGAISSDLSQKTESSVYPIGSLGIAAAVRPWVKVPVGLSLSLGNWGGRILSRASSVADRNSSITLIGAELAATAGFKKHLDASDEDQGEIGADLKLGIGMMASPLWTIDAWKDSTTISSYYVSFGRKWYLLSGLSLSYSRPLSSYILAFLLSGDMGLASFQAGDTALLSRVSLGLSLARRFNIKKGDN